jgi:hypothetical protein
MHENPGERVTDRSSKRARMQTRRMERAHLIYFLRVFDAASGELLGQMVDLTPDGIMVIGEAAVVPRQKYQLRMDLPRNVPMGRHLTVEARCKWCRRDPGGDFHSMGFRLLDMSPEAHQVVDQLIEKFYRDGGEEDPAADMNPPL